jgi:hypothetical protein
MCSVCHLHGLSSDQIFYVTRCLQHLSGSCSSIAFFLISLHDIIYSAFSYRDVCRNMDWLAKSGYVTDKNTQMSSRRRCFDQLKKQVRMATWIRWHLAFSVACGKKKKLLMVTRFLEIQRVQQFVFSLPELICWFPYMFFQAKGHKTQKIGYKKYYSRLQTVKNDFLCFFLGWWNEVLGWL